MKPGEHARSGLAAVGQYLVVLGRVGLIAIQLGLLLLVIRTFSIENSGFFKVVTLASAGFVVHALLPAGLRLPFFGLLSLAGIALILGPANGARLVALGLILIGLAHLPVRFAVRLVLILIAGCILVACRGQLLKVPSLAGIWPIFGAMFMFRMIVYLYDLKNRAAPFGFWRSLAYFFMVPNLNFTLFPVVDYKKFSRGWFATDRYVTYQTGVNWIFRGLIQMILYRAVYQYLPSDPASVGSASSAALYLVRPYLLYLRISGSFHVAMGIMHLFGFNLPRTNYNYLLASSFTDYWRRVNIYWKDFLQKIFFNPFYMVFKRSMSSTAALVVTTAIAFFATWALHSYQWFWIRGSFPVIWQDIVFWGVMGSLVLANMIWEQRRGRTRSLAATKRPPRAMLGLALRTVGTFLVIAISWAIWSAQSFAELKLVAGKLLTPGPADVAWIIGGLVVLGIVAVLYDRFQKAGRPEVESAPRIRLLGVPVPVSAFRVGLVSAALVVVVFGQSYFYYPARPANVINQLRNPLVLSARDAQALTRGYYEDLGDVSRFNPELAALFKDRPADWNRCWALHRTGGFPSHELLPSRRVIHKGAELSTNRWRMRDRDYEQSKPPGTYRFAMLGSSHAMGEGVADAETFENVVEDRLNREISPRTGVRYEILNFSVAGWGPIANLTELDRRVFDFQPDAVIFTGITEFNWVIKELAEEAAGYYQLPWPELHQMAEAAGVKTGMEDGVVRATLRPHREELLYWVYSRVVDLCKQHGAVPIAAFISNPVERTPETKEDEAGQVAVAKRAGFAAVIDMVDAYSSLSKLDGIWLADWDRHPNAEGNRMVADKLYEGLVGALGVCGVGGAPADAAGDGVGGQASGSEASGSETSRGDTRPGNE